MKKHSHIQLDVERTRLQAIWQERCPQCREGKMFKHTWWQLSKFDEMHKNCPVCDLRFEVEPGFWYGAMFVSYGITIGLLVALGFLIYWLFNDPSIMGYVVPIVLISVLAVPFNFRISRSIFLHLFGFVAYKPVKRV